MSRRRGASSRSSSASSSSSSSSASSSAPEVCGIYATEDEGCERWKRALGPYDGLMPKFSSSEECLSFMDKHVGQPTNPADTNLTHMFTTLVSWSQVQEHLVAKLAEYDARYPASPPARGSDALRGNRFVPGGGGGDGDVDGNGGGGESKSDAACASSSSSSSSDPVSSSDPGEAGVAGVAGVAGFIQERMDLPFHRRTNREATMNTLRYLFFHMRSGIFVMIRRKRVVMFVPFVNSEYTNTWGDRITVDDGAGGQTESTDGYYARKMGMGSREENVIPDKKRWWANGNIMCNEHHSPDQKYTQWWNDMNLIQMRDMLEEACRERTVVISPNPFPLRKPNPTPLPILLVCSMLYTPHVPLPSSYLCLHLRILGQMMYSV
jgi:hypothetical protein